MSTLDDIAKKITELKSKKEQYVIEIQKQTLISDEEKRRLQLIEIQQFAEEAQKERDKNLVETLSPLYKELESFLGSETNPKLIWLLTALLTNTAPQTMTLEGMPQGGNRIFHTGDLLQKLEILKRAKGKVK